MGIYLFPYFRVTCGFSCRKIFREALHEDREVMLEAFLEVLFFLASPPFPAEKAKNCAKKKPEI